MNQLKNCNNYNICDFSFLSKILEHPRIEYSDVINIITFVLSITFKNIQCYMVASYGYKGMFFSTINVLGLNILILLLEQK